MPDKKYLIEIPGMPEGSGVWDSDKWERNKDAFMSDYPEANVFELGEYDAEDTNENDQIMLTFENDPDSSGVWDSAKWERNKEAFTADHPEAKVNRVRYVDYWSDRASAIENRLAELEKPDEERAARLAEIGYFDDKENAVNLDGNLKPVSQAMKVNSVSGDVEYLDPAVEEFFANDDTYTKRQLEKNQLKAEYDANPSVIAQREWEAQRKEAEKAYRNELKQQITAEYESNVDKNKAARGGIEIDGVPIYGPASFETEKQEKYLAALQLLDFAERMENGEKFWEGVGYGTTKAAVDYDGKEMIQVGLAFKKLEDRGVNILEATEEEIDEALDPEDKALMRAYLEYEKAMYEAEPSNAFKGGAQFGETIPFILEFIATGNIYKAGAKKGMELAGKKAIGKGFAKWIAKSAGKKIPTLMKRGVAKASTGTIKALSGTLTRTLASPTTYTKMATPEIQISEQGDVSVETHAAREFFDHYIENLSEISGEGMVAGLGGAAKLLKSTKIGKMPFMKLGEWFGNKAVWQGLSKLGAQSLPIEVAEEIVGNALRYITGVDKEALGRMFEKDEFASMLIGFAPLTVLGMGTSAASMGAVNIGAARAAKRMRETLNPYYTEEQIDNVIGSIEGAKTSDEVVEALRPIMVGMYNATPEEKTAVMDYGISVAKKKAMISARNFQEMQLSDASVRQIEDNIGKFWIENEDKTRTVRQVNLNDGRQVYIVSQPNEVGEVATVEVDTGKKGMAKLKDIKEEIFNSSLESYGTRFVMADRKAKEQERMANERQEQINLVRQNLAAQKGKINLGTEGSPIMVIADAENEAGVRYVAENGSTGNLSWDAVADAMGTPIRVFTDSQIVEQEIADIVARDAERKAQRAQQKGDNAVAASEAVAEASETVDAVAQETKHIPLNEDGTVNEAAFWEQDPEGYAQWNDEQNQDGGADTIQQIEAAKAELTAMLNEAQQATLTSNPANRKAAKREVGRLAERLARLEALEQSYADRALAPLRERAKMWADLTGAPVHVIETEEELAAISATVASENAKPGSRVRGFAKDGKAYIFLPGIQDVREIDEVFFHEAVAHNGLKGLLGKENYDKLCEQVWNMMSPAARNQFIRYPGVNGDYRAAADEYIAHIAEKMGANIAEAEEKTIWQKIVDFVRSVLRAMGIELNVTEQELSDLLHQAYADLANNMAKAEQTASREAMSAVEEAPSEARQQYDALLEDLTPEEIEAVAQNDFNAAQEAYNAHLANAPKVEPGESSKAYIERKKAYNDELKRLESELNAQQALMDEISKAKQTETEDEAIEPVEDLDQVQQEDGTFRLSVVTYNDWTDNLGNQHKGTRTMVLERMVAMNFTDAEINDMMRKMDTAYEYMEKLRSLTNEDGSVRFDEFNEWAKATPMYKQVGRDFVKAITSLVSNGDYPINMELTTDCIKREAYTMLLNTLIKRGADLSAMGPGEIVTIQKMMKQYGIETACALCFVEGKRLQIVNWASQIVEDWNAALVEAGVETEEHFGFGKDGDAFIPAEEWRTHENKAEVAKVMKQLDEIDLLFRGIDPVQFKKQKAKNKKAIEKYKKEKAEAWAKKTKKPVSQWKPTDKQEAEIKKMAKEGLAPTYVNENMEEYRNAFNAMRNEWLEKHPGKDPLSFTPTKKQWEALGKIRNRQIDTVKAKMVRLIMEYPEMRKKMTLNDLLGSKGLMEIRQQHGQAYADLYSIILQRFGTGTPKPVQDAVPYDGELMTLSESAFKKANEIGGARLFSFSDFDITKVFDYMQMFFDLEANRQMLQSYTKEVAAVIIFGRSNAKFNISTLANAYVPQEVLDKYAKASEKEQREMRHQWAEYAGLQIDEAGNITGINFSEEHSVSPAFAQQIFHDDARNKDCGAIMVGASVNHAIYSAAQAWIRMVIPFHLSGMPKAAQDKTDVKWYFDNTPFQSTRKKTKEGWSKIESSEDTFKLYDDMSAPGWNMRDKAKQYLAWCAEKGFRPKFDWGINSDYYRAYCEEYGYTPNQQIIDIMDADTTDGVWNQYYKFLTDFTAYKPVFNEQGEMIDEIPSPQLPVVANFDFSELEREVLFEGENSMLGRREENIQKAERHMDALAAQVVPYLNGEITEDEMGLRDDVFYKSSTDAENYLEEIEKQMRANKAVPEWFKNIRRSQELDQNNSPFILAPDGGIDFGEILPIHHLPAAPIRLSEGDAENGYIHINNRHGKEIQKQGFNSIEDFVKFVVDNFTRIQEGSAYENETGGQNQTYLVQLQDKHNNTLFIQLSRDGQYWNVNSAGVFKKNYGNNKKNIWSASEVQNDNSAVVDNGLQSEPNADTGSTSNGTPSDVSKGKDSENLVNTSDNTRLSVITPQMDAEYLAAVEAGDMETVQRMVLEAAKLAMPNTKVVDENGNPKVVYHGTAYGGFTKFTQSPDEFFAHTGFFFADTRKAVEDYTYGENQDVDHFFPFDKRAEGQLEIVNDWLKTKAKGRNNQGIQVAEENGEWVIVDEKGNPIKDSRGNRKLSGKPSVVMGIIQAYEEHTPEFDGKGVYSTFLNLQNPLVIDAKGESWGSLPMVVDGIKIPSKYDSGQRGVVVTDDWVDYLQSEEGKKLGYDSLIVTDVYDSHTADGTITDYIAFDSAQIKLSAPVTYDDAGNVIPLSKRFNPANEDIRFSVRTDEQREKLFADAKAEFGLTDNFNVAGYMLPDGSLLNFGDPANPTTRAEDHRAIEGVIMENGTEYDSRWMYLADFMNEGAIRLLPEYAGINLMKAPTKEQRQKLFDFIYKYNGEVILEIADERLNNVAYVEYDRRTSPSRIFRDIDGYFNEGIVPEQDVRFSVRTVNQTAQEFHNDALTDFRRQFNLIQPTTVVDVNDRAALAEALGLTPEELSDEKYQLILDGVNDGGRSFYDDDTKRIAIFALEKQRTSAEVDENIFHENTHAIVSKNTEVLELGQWLWDNAKSGIRMKTRNSILDSNYPEWQYANEMLSRYTGIILSMGRAGEVLNMLPADQKKHWEFILKEFGYEPEREDGERIRRYDADSRRAGFFRKMSQQKMSDNGTSARYSAEERRVINELFPGAIQEETRFSADIATELENARANVDTDPTEAQKEAGNYKMGHLRLDGYNITIENPKGSVRRGTDSKGNEWKNTLNNDYGYIRGTEGVDGDHIDVYLSDNPAEGNVFVIDQVNPETREFDEHKVMYGFNSEEEARNAYLANFSEGWNGLGTITEVTKDEFRKWIDSSHRKTKPFSEYKSVKTDILDEGDIRYSLVTDPALLERLESEPTIKVYRAMQLIDGKLYPPMSAKVDGKMREPIELGKWEQAEERPDLADEKGYFKLDKGNKTSLKARYNPYFHTSPTPLNDQFSSAQTRPELVTVEVEVPESELTSGYKAEKAKDSVGKMEWKAGVIQGKLSGTRTVILSRWDKPVRIVPDSEVADVIVKMFEGKDITMPSNVVTPSLRAELEKKGVPFVETDNSGKPMKEDVRFSVVATPTEIEAVKGLSILDAMNISLDHEMTMVKDMIDAERALIKNLQKKNQNPLIEQQIQNAEKRLAANLRQMEILQEVEDQLIDTKHVEPDYQSALSDMEPQTRFEYLSQMFTMRLSPITQTKVTAEDGTETTVRQGGKKKGLMLTPQTLVKDLGWSKSDWKGISYIVSESEGTTIDAIAEMIEQDSEAGYLFAGMDTMQIKDEIIDFLWSMDTYASIRDYIKNERTRKAEEEAEHANEIIDKFIERLESEYGMSADAYNAMIVQQSRAARESWLASVENPNEFAKFEESKDEENGRYTDNQGENRQSISTDGGTEDAAASGEGDSTGEAVQERVPGDSAGNAGSSGPSGNIGRDDSGSKGEGRRDGVVPDDVETSRKSVDEIVETGKQKVVEANAAAADAFMLRLRKINGNLMQLRRAASAQREYDKNTVQIITSLANELLENGALSDMTRGEIKRLLSVIKDSVGKSDLTISVDRLMDIMIGNQLRFGRNRFYDYVKIRDKKVDARGVEVRGKLDVEGQMIMNALREGIGLDAEKLQERISEAEDRLFDTSETIRRNAENDLVGYQIALEYLNEIKASETEEKDLRKELKTAKEEYGADRMTKETYREFVKSTNDAIRENRMQRVMAYEGLLEKMADMIQKSIRNAGQLRETEKQRIEQIQHYANSDMQGMPADEHKAKDSAFWNNPIVRFLFKPLATFDQMLRHFAPKSRSGEGYLWNHFMGGWLKATENEYKGIQSAHEKLDAKAKSVFGNKVKRWSDLFALERKMPKAEISFWDAGEIKSFEVTQGNLLYIYMVNKMTDGKMKLRRMGISEEDVINMTRELDPRFVELADWLQEDFLPGLREKYNAVHEKLFGAPMAAIDNYFPIRVLANARSREVDINIEESNAKPSTITGNIIKRTKNSLALDILGSNAFDVVLGHINDMERWAAFAEWNKDLNTLLSYKKFRNRVQNMSGIYGAGSVVWNNFRSVAEIAAGVYKPATKADSVDKTIMNIAKGVTGAKISFRVYTAFKQLLSWPAFISDANPVILAKNMANPFKAWNWSMENLPLFEKRWKSRQAGDSRLMKTDADWKLWKSKVVEIAGRLGMTPNALVDAVTVAIGARSVYETRLKQYLDYGYDQEKAEEKAKRDATVTFNESQQSNESAFLSQIQMDRTVASVVLTVFRNSSMGYQRMYVDALRNITHMTKRGYKAESIEYMKKQMMRDGLTEAQAERAANRIYSRSFAKNAVQALTFGFIVQLAWNLGPYLPYIFIGDDDEEKKEMAKDAAVRALVGGPVEGMSGGPVLSNISGNIALGEKLSEVNGVQLPLASDMENLFKLFGKDNVRAINEIFNIIVQSGIGVNPQTITDAAVAIVDACNGDLETASEAAICLMRILQVPQSQIEEIYLDEIDFTAEEALDLTIREFAERYARYKVLRSAPLTNWMYDDEQEKEREESYIKRFTSRAEELKRTRGSEAAKTFYEYYDNEYAEMNESLRELKRRAKEAEGAESKAISQEADSLVRTESFQRYSDLIPDIKAYEAYKKLLKDVTDPATREEYEKAMLRHRDNVVNKINGYE